MSSVQSFLRQRVVGTTTFVPAASNRLYVLVAGAASTGSTTLGLNAASNYVGNYPPGLMIAGPLISDLQGESNELVNPIYRDMGKTVYAQLATSASATSNFGAPGFWRAVQVIDPVAVASATAATNFGVTGSARGLLPAGNTGDQGYNTYYIPIVVGGVIPGTAAATSVPLTLSGADAPVSLAAGNVL
jgi:hypothetical protein